MSQRQNGDECEQRVEKESRERKENKRETMCRCAKEEIMRLGAVGEYIFEDGNQIWSGASVCMHEKK
jgi:hypothetical protein